MFPARLILCVILLFGSSGCLVYGKEPEPSAVKAADDTQLFAWFDQLGIEDFSHAKLVRVQISSEQDLTANKIRFDAPRGFLLWEKDGQFCVLLSDLTVSTFDAIGTDPTKEDYVGWREVSLEEEATALVRLFEQEKQNEFWADNHDTYSDRIDLRTQAFVLARYCATQGRNDLTKRLLQTVSHVFYDLHGAKLQEELAEEISAVLRWRANLALADSHQDRHALAGLFRNIVQHCPKSPSAKLCAKTATGLEQMAAEDDAHRKLSEVEFARLNPAEQARELVFQLRDDYAIPDGGETWNRPWPVEPTKGNGAYKKLVALGLSAVPALIEAAKDDRPTRSVYRAMTWGGMSNPSSIQELALQALEEIAGVNFLWLVPHTETMPIEELRKQATELVVDWMKTTQEEGDIAWLRARVVTGAEGAQYCLQAIAKRHPEALVDLALNTIPNMTDPQARADMLKQLRKTNTPEVNQLLLDELTKGPTVSNRVAAAEILRERHQPEALSAMLTEFTALPVATLNWAASGGPAAALQIGAAGNSRADSPTLLLTFLISSDSVFALDQIRGILPEANPYLRAAIVQEYGRRLPVQGDPNIEPAGRELRRAVESLLIAELNDNVMLKDRGVGGFKSPSVAELAAWMLALNWPEKYHFDWNTSPEAHAAQLVNLRAQTGASRPVPPK